MKHHYRIGLTTLAALLTFAVSGADVREEFHQTYKLGGSGQVSLDNVNGSVTITAWDRNEVKVDAVKRARTQEHLDAVKIDVKTGSGRIEIRTKYPENNKNNSTSVDYTLTVPEDSQLSRINTVNGGVEIERVRGDVEANSVNGQVTAKGLMGKTELSTVNGSVKAALNEVRRPVSLRSVNGSVSVSLPANVNADISADALNGGITCDFDIKATRNFPIGQKLDGKLGSGGPLVKLSTVNGGVHIDRTKAVSAEEEK